MIVLWSKYITEIMVFKNLEEAVFQVAKNSFSYRYRTIYEYPDDISNEKLTLNRYNKLQPPTPKRLSNKMFNILVEAKKQELGIPREP